MDIGFCARYDGLQAQWSTNEKVAFDEGVGAAIGGLVSGLWGIYPAFVIDGLTFILSAFFIAQMVYQPSDQLDAAEKTVGAALRQYIDGLIPDVTTHRLGHIPQQ